MFNPSKSTRTLLAGLSLASALCGTSFALPEGGTVGNGQVNIGSPMGGQMTIQQLSDRAIINWNGFSINAGELVRFVQPSQLSAILNRITGQDPSLILGSLQANGRVFLVNPNGIVFGKDSQVDVGSLFATTLTLKDEDFLHDRFKLDLANGQSPAAIINQGTLQMSPGGFLVLASPLISNQGVILANVGQVALAAGSHSEINFDGQGLINLMVEAPHVEPGTVAISRGMLDNMVGDLLNLGPANSITSLNDGVQVAGAEGRLINTGQIHADGAPGQAAGRIVVNSSNGTFLRPGSLISANGQGENSNGGNVFAISEGLAVLDQGATLEAKPGTSGDGGFVEFSGHTGFRFNGQVDPGATGHFLLDPTDLTIIHFPPQPGTQDPNLAGDGTIAFNDANQTPNTVSDEAINTNTAGLITLQAVNSITQNANAPISLATAGHAISLSTQNGDINLLGGISTNQGDITVSAGGQIALGSTVGAPVNFTTNPGAGTISMTAGNGGSAGAIVIAANLSADTINLTASNAAGAVGSIKYDPALTPGSVMMTATSSATLTALNGPTNGIFGLDPIVTPPGLPLQVHTPSLNLSATGNIYVQDQMSAVVNANSSAGVAAVLVTGDATVGNAGIAGPLATGLIATGNIVANGSSGTVGNSTSETLLQGVNIGTAANPLKTKGNKLDLLASGNSKVSQTGATTLFLQTGGSVGVASDSTVNIANSGVTIPLLGPKTFTTNSASPLTISTTGGLIANAPGSAPTLNGSIVTLTAPGGIGAPGNHVLTSSPTLVLTSTGGDIRVSDAQSAQVDAGAGGQVDLSVTGSVTVLSLGIKGTGATAVAATGDILSTGTSDRVGVAGSATTLSGANIGTVANPIKTAGQSVSVQTTGQLHLDQAGATELSVLTTPTGDVSVASDSSVTIGNTFATAPAANLNISTTSGSIAYNPALNKPTLEGNTITLTAPAGIGTATLPLKTSASNLALTSTAGSVNVAETDSVSVTTGVAGQDFALSGGPMSLHHIQAGQAITLNAAGDILGTGATPVLTGSSANLTATGTIGASGMGNALTTQVSTLNLSGANGVFVEQEGAVAVSANSSAGAIDLNINGDATLGLLDAATTIRVQTCPTGSILDGNGDALNIKSGQGTILVSHGVIGTRPDPLDVNVASDALYVAAGSQLDGVSVSIKGTAPTNALNVVAPPDPPVGTTCFAGMPPGLVLFNDGPPPQPPNPTPDRIVPDLTLQRFTEDQQALQAVQINSTLFNPPLILDIRGEVMGSAFTPFYTFALAFLLDEESWLAFLQDTVVWEDDGNEAQEIK